MIRIIRHRLVELLASIIGLEALLVMAGWIFGIDQLMRFTSFGTNMKFMSAFLFFVSAMGLYFISRAMRGNRDVSQTALPGIVLTIFITTAILFASRLLGVSTGIERLFVTQPNPIDLTVGVSVNGLPSLSVCIGFILFGFAGVAALFPSRIGRMAISYLGILIFILGFVAIVGYVFQLPVLYYESSSSISMAFNTALLFVLLGTGLRIACRDTASNET